MSPPRPQKRTLIKKLQSSLRYLIETIASFSPTAKVCDCTTGLFNNNTVSRFCGRPSRKALREELRSDHADELAVFLNSKATKEELRIVGIMLMAAH